MALVKNKSITASYRKKVVIVLSLIVALTAGYYLMVTWPHNVIGKVAYRLLGKKLPLKKSEELAYIRQFLSAKRMLDKKELAQARAKLEIIKGRVQPNFLFFREIYFYLGYIYDVQGDFGKEEALYSELQEKDVVLSKFLYGLYYFRHGQDFKARENLTAALSLDRKYRRLNIEFRNMLQRTMVQISRQGKNDLPVSK